MKFKITLILLLCLQFGFAQVTNQGKPLSWKLQGLEAVAPVVMPKFDLATLQAEDKANENKKDMIWRFGYEFLVDHNLNNSGNWHTLPNGDRLWRIRYQSAGAKTMNFLFSDFYMPAGAKVYLYDNEHTDVLGAYDAQQNNEEHVLGTWLVKGQDIWIEYYEPAAVAGQGKLEIFKVVHGYRTSEGLLKSPDDDLNGSGNCNYDVNCTLGGIDDLKDINKKAVALIITNNSGFCTGSLVNNTSNDGTPYFLTANHCYSNPSQWAFRFNWISPNPVCAGNTPSTSNAPDYYQTASGASLKARNEASDFCLVQITANMPASWDLVYAGWDRSDVAPPSTFGIHHPQGDIMKVCKDDNAPTAENDGEADVWVVGNWELGVTEGGSSGSPLFNNEGRIIGQLFYGSSDCAGLVNNGGYDAYGRFGRSWDNGTTVNTRLSDWLDPEGTEALTLDYYPPAEVFAVDAKAVIAGLGQGVCGSTITPIIRIDNKGTENLTSAQINYTFNNGEAGVLPFTGNLATNESYVVTLPEMQGIQGTNTFTFTITNVNNGATDGNTNNNTTSANFVVEEIPVYALANINFSLVTDQFGYETTWNLKDAAGTVLYSGGPYGFMQQETINTTFTVPAEGCYIFGIYDEEGDGICCDYGEGSFSLITANGTVIAEGAEYGAEFVAKFRMEEELSVSNSALKNAVTVYPNPSSGVFTVSAAGNQALTYQLYNVLGQAVTSGKITTQGTINITGAANGVYMLKVTEQASGKSANYKLVKE
ncbi:hypothetical protein Q765_11180 [Flavobacterium rivuli WB 3.3-2 = DSM 21788]|uniref:Secretion system C-terminal sorting domain-containing protein n=1 Tax=Flavobacterium rivuli WB 3.3-2 = DSM 21788 TaxID=1121895 RepID=A0A0A2MDQ6_9FLAO|nr:T9SS type A sorting domain-containing protein [Flavobacterium rivuli]KGO86435.1 hypothetical protein Q765_11180 [Flavobacterium rivuli WB 3.3-2 = DSM 21788]